MAVRSRKLVLQVSFFRPWAFGLRVLSAREQRGNPERVWQLPMLLDLLLFSWKLPEES
jgi:hypothetical protein